MPRAPRFSAITLVLAVLLAGCSGPAASFDPSGPCTTDGRAPGAYPEIEALVPRRYREEAPATLDSGRNCSAANLGPLASAGISEVRFAGATWSFGAERAVVLAIFQGNRLTADALANFYLQGAQAAPRTTILAATEQIVAGRRGSRLDTKSGERLQTVVVWPSTQRDTVNVVISNDLPDERIQEATDAFAER
ncbi:MAG: hypothetical protein H0T59_07075 [Chloroflexi bacterium]|nr:hypothetical protein [Chloroflexota bacterium]